MEPKKELKILADDGNRKLVRVEKDNMILLAECVIAANQCRVIMLSPFELAIGTATRNNLTELQIQGHVPTLIIDIDEERYVKRLLRKTRTFEDFNYAYRYIRSLIASIVGIVDYVERVIS